MSEDDHQVRKELITENFTIAVEGFLLEIVDPVALIHDKENGMGTVET